jgi:glycosyltransferase involved in cell wall biosynthesis
LLTLIRECIYHRPQFIYFQISPVGIPFWRDFIYLFVIKLFNIKIVYHIHGKGIQKYIGDSKIIRKVYIWALNKSSVICLADSLTFDLKNIFHGIPYIVNNAIPLINYTGFKSIESKSVNILFLSNLFYSKGVIDYLDAIVILKNEGIGNFKAFIAGKEADMTAETLMLELNKREITDSVTFMGPKFDNEKWELLKNSDLFVFPTYYACEAFPVVLIEAMQSGLPVIATREGAIPEIVDDGVTGFLVDYRNPGQIAEKLKILINDPRLRKNMSEAGREKFLQKYTFDIFEKKMKNIFIEIMEETSNS